MNSLPGIWKPLITYISTICMCVLLLDICFAFIRFLINVNFKLKPVNLNSSLRTWSNVYLIEKKLKTTSHCFNLIIPSYL